MYSKIQIAERAVSDSDTEGCDSGNKYSSSDENMGNDSGGDDVTVIDDTRAACPLLLGKTNGNSATSAS